MPKREGYLMEEIVEYGNIADSIAYVLRGRRHKKSPLARYIWAHRDWAVRFFQWQLWLGLFHPTEYREMEISEYGKTRKIQCTPIYDRIMLNAVMKVVERRLHGRLILNSAASVKGRGLHWLMHRMTEDLRHIPTDKRIVRKDDIRKFYESIPQELARKVVRRCIKDRRVIAILDRCIGMMPQGISIGLRSSQFIALLVLAYTVDHRIKDSLGVRHYYRYCDDGLSVCSSFRQATMVARECHRAIEGHGMRIKGNEQVWRHTDRPIDFLGYVVSADGNVRIRKHIKQRFARRWKRVRSSRRKTELTASFLGVCRHARARHLFETITGISMRNFSDFGLSYESPDGKKHFDVERISLNEVVNTEVVVKDFETDIKTREGEGRYIVLVEVDGKERKFITNSGEMKQFLDKISHIEDGFPFLTTIRRVSFGTGKYKYIFS